MRIAILSMALVSLLSFLMPNAYASTKGQSDGMKFLIRIASPEEIKRQKEIEQRKAKETKSTSPAMKSEPSKTEEAFRKKKQEEKKAEPEPTKRWE